MQVKDLIKRLERFDTNSTVAIIDNHWVGAISTDPIVRRVRVDIVGDSLLTKGEVSDSAESVVLISFKGAHA